MTVYDCTLILNPQLEESVLEDHIKSAKDLIDRKGGKMVKDNRIGMRRLAYEINKLTQGYYVSLVFEGTGEIVKELERQFRLEEACLRFLTCIYKEFDKREVRPVRRVPSRSDAKPALAEKSVTESKPVAAATAVEEKPKAESKDKPTPEEPEEL